MSRLIECLWTKGTLRFCTRFTVLPASSDSGRSGTCLARSPPRHAASPVMLLFVFVRYFRCMWIFQLTRTRQREGAQIQVVRGFLHQRQLGQRLKGWSGAAEWKASEWDREQSGTRWQLRETWNGVQHYCSSLQRDSESDGWGNPGHPTSARSNSVAPVSKKGVPHHVFIDVCAERLVYGVIQADQYVYQAGICVT